MSPNPVVEFDGLTKRFGGFTAVDDLDLAVEAGETFGFLGPNGAGKSTTIDLLLDFIRPTNGTVDVLGHDPRTESRAVRKKVGILPEGYDLYDRLTARQHLSYAAELSHGDPEAILDRVGLGDAGGRSVGGFSKGMRQRLALGMALVGDPDLLILDEPSSGLDPNGVREMRSIVREEADRGATVFFSSHLMEQVDAVCDRAGIMSAGKLVAVDAIDDLRATVDDGPVLVLTVEDPPEDADLAGLDGVRDVTITGTTIKVHCHRPDMKATAIAAVEDAGSTVTDIDVEETSLEAVFSAYTSGGESMPDEARVEDPPAGEPSEERR